MKFPLLNKRKLPIIEVHLVSIKHPQNFVDPNPDYQATILDKTGKEVGSATFGISPLCDVAYVYRIDVLAEHQRRGYASAFLCWLYSNYHHPIIPIHIVGDARNFWSATRAFPHQLLVVQDELRASEMDAEKKRWEHLIPEPEHKQLQRICESSPTWQQKFQAP